MIVKDKKTAFTYYFRALTYYLEHLLTILEDLLTSLEDLLTIWERLLTILQQLLTILGPKSLIWHLSSASSPWWTVIFVGVGRNRGSSFRRGGYGRPNTRK